MPISPELAFGVKPIQLPSPIEAAQKVNQLDLQAQALEHWRQQQELANQTIADNALKLAASKRDQAGQAATAAAVQKFRGEDGSIDWQRVSNEVSGLGFPEHGSKILDAATANAKHLEDLAASRATVQKATAAAAARMALAIDWSDPANIAAHVHVAAGSGLLPEELADQLLSNADKIAADPKIGQQITDRLLSGAPDVAEEVAKRKQSAATLAKTEAETELIKAGGGTWQRDDVLLDGKPAVVLINPKRPGEVRDLSGQAIDNAGTRVKPKPTTAAPAEAAVDEGPIDIAPPSGVKANTPDPRTGQTPNAIHQNALAYALEGKLPAMGMGSSPRVSATRSAIQNRAAALAAAAGTDLPTLRAEYGANRVALNRLVPMARATTTFSQTALDNLGLAEAESGQIARTGSKLTNRYIQWLQGELTPAAGLTKFETYIYTAAREYAKVTSGGALSAQALSDSAAKEAAKLLNTAQAPEAFSAAVTAMKDDMANVIRRQNESVQKVSPAIASFLSVAGGGPILNAPPAAGGAALGGLPPVPEGQMRIRNLKNPKQTAIGPKGPVPPGWELAP